MDKGEQLIVCGDFNSEYVKLSEWFLDEGLRDMLVPRHGKCPITYQRSRQDPLDCIFGSPSMTIKKGGCLAFNNLISDHRGVWIDIPNELLLGFNPPPLSHPAARRLKINDPRIVKKYNTLLHEACLKDNLYERWDDLHGKVTTPLTKRLALEYETLDAIQEQHMSMAESKCRNLHTGVIPWSPTYKKVQLELDYWRMRLKHKLGMHRNVRQLIGMQNKLGIKYDANLQFATLKKNISTCYKRRTKIKAMAESLSLEYRHQLAAAKEAAGEIKAATYIRSLNRVEKQRKLFQNIRQMEMKIKGGSTNKVVVTQEDGETVEYVKKEDIEKVISESNEKKGHQTEGGSQLLNKEFIEKLGHYGEGPEVHKVKDGTFSIPEHTTTETKDFLMACKQHKDLHLVEGEVSIIPRYKHNMVSWKKGENLLLLMGTMWDILNLPQNINFSAGCSSNEVIYLL